MMMMSRPPIPKDESGYYHPKTEQEIVNIVKYAYDNDFQLRVRGSGHSIGPKIYTDVCTVDRVDVAACAPDGNNINIRLDEYIRILDVSGNRVTVEAGIHLGHEPNDKHSTVENSLLYQLNNKHGLTVGDLGGINHQTVGGFLSTGSSGGSVKYGFSDNIHALRMVDGTGQIYTVSRDDADQNHFRAALVSLGVLGVISTVTFDCVPSFNISGSQLSAPSDQCQVDLYDDNPRKDGKIGLTSFLVDNDYARILWWPQTRGVVGLEKERLQVWHANRIPCDPYFKPTPYKLFDSAEIMIAYSYMMTILGNINDMDAVRTIAAEKDKQFEKLMKAELEEKGIDNIPATAISKVLKKVNEFILNVVTGTLDKISVPIRETILPVLTTAAVTLLSTEVDSGCIKFQDYSWHGLPMDNSADDILIPTMWSEIWVPLQYATKATTMLSEYFHASGKISCTGNNAWELYAAKPCEAWMSMSYSDGSDEWKYGAFRIDPYWFIDSNCDARTFFRPVWLLLHNKNIPFRLHWAKLFPKMDDTDYDWRKILIHSQYPHFRSFLDLRRSKDPKQIFLSSYWRYWLGIDLPKY
ncbi:uncharacterized protein [Dysidea avara]|uniref:uncharacterized protein isoform X1 n=1 Tax=Dysidea avara TaxID=196820 RepID=UPI003331B670